MHSVIYSSWSFTDSFPKLLWNFSRILQEIALGILWKIIEILQYFIKCLRYFPFVRVQISKVTFVNRMYVRDMKFHDLLPIWISTLFLNTVLNKSFATLHICPSFGSLCFTNHLNIDIFKKTNYLHKQNNNCKRILLVGCVFNGKIIHLGCITKSAQNHHTQKHDSNNTPHLFNHTLGFVWRLRLGKARRLVTDTLFSYFLVRFFSDPPTLCAVIAYKRKNEIQILLFL